MKFRWFSRPISVRYADVARSLEGLDVETIRDVKQTLESINLKGTTRLVTKTVSPVTIYVDNVNGSDTAGDGSASNPYKTFARALMDVGEFYDANVTIVLKASNTSYDDLNISGITRRNINSTLTIQGEMIVLDSGVVVGFSNAVDDPVYGSLVQVAKITTDKYFQPDQYKHKLLRVYKGGTSYYRIITNNDTNSIYCSYTFPVTLDETWNWEILDWGTKCNCVYCYSNSTGINFSFLDIVRPSNSYEVVVRDSGYFTTFLGCRIRSYPQQTTHMCFVNNSSLSFNSCFFYADRLSGAGRGIFLTQKCSYLETVGCVFDNFERRVIENLYEGSKVNIAFGTRFYKGTTNPDFCIVMAAGVLMSLGNYGKSLIDCGSTGVWLTRGGIAQNISNLVFGPNVSVSFSSQFGLLDGGKFIVSDNIGVMIPNSDYTNLHSRLQIHGSIATQVTTVTADTTLGVNHHIVLVDASGGNRTITLPNATTCAGRQYIVKKIDSSANTVTISAQAGQTIDGRNSVVLNTQYQTVTVVSDGNNWYKIAG